MGNKIYTIGREFGSQGHQIGRKLAERLGIKCYDKELLQKAAKESGFCEEIFENHDEKATSSFLYSLVMDTYSAGNYTAAPFLDMPLNHKVFLAQFDTIKNIAEKESCVIVGRCADYILKDSNPFRVFVYADMDSKIERCRRKGKGQENLTDKEMKKYILDIDKNRARYYEFYTDQKWGDLKNYDIALNTSTLSFEQCAETIVNLYNNK
jgi:cytidylate kinase